MYIMEIIKKSHLDPSLPKSTFHHIGQDIKKSDSTCENIYKSSIKRDFPALGYVTKQSRIPSPKSAKIFSVEARINEQKSLTATHFAKRTVTERATLSEVAKLAFGTKNLMKMDVDNRAMSFDTTNKLYFPARVLEMVKGKDDMMRSSIPQGMLSGSGLKKFYFAQEIFFQLSKNLQKCQIFPQKIYGRPS